MISLRIQSLATVLLALVSLLAGPVAAYSSLFGSLAALVPSALFTVIVLSVFMVARGRAWRDAVLRTRPEHEAEALHRASVARRRS